MKALSGIVATLLLCLVWLDSPAVMEIEITEGVEGALPIAITAFAGDEYAGPQELENIISNDLHSSGLFDVLDRNLLPRTVAGSPGLDYRAWRNSGAESLLAGRVSRVSEDEYRIEFRLYDLVRQKKLSGHAISSVNRKDVRKVAHKISDMVFEELIGVRGTFSTRIAYVETVQDSAGTKYELRIADMDGFNSRTIFSSAGQLMSPSWSPDGMRLAYVSFEGGNSAIYVQDVTRGTRIRASAQSGMNSAPAWSPDGRYLALTLSIHGSPDIYIMDAQTGHLKRITDNEKIIDTEACWTPDSKALLFTSDRQGETQIYRVLVRERRVERVTREGRYNAAPEISPDGRHLAMVHNNGSGFRIAVMDLRSGKLRVLTEGNMDEGPSYAPNGKIILYATSVQGRNMLAAVSSNGRVNRRLHRAGEGVRAPAWSPFND